MYLNAFGQPIVVLQSLKAAYELLDKRANISSDRPRYIVAHEILCGGLFTASMLYGDLSAAIASSEASSLMCSPTDGAALAAPHTKGSRNWQFATITRFSVKKPLFFLPQSWAVKVLSKSIFSVFRPLRSCPYYMTTPRLRTNMTKPLSESTRSLAACRKPQFQGHTSSSCSLG